MRHELFPVEELAPGDMRSVEIGNIRVVIIRKPDGSVRALRDRCSHMGAPLSVGWLRRAMDGDDVGQCAYLDQYVVRCPWHYYEFNVDTGLSMADAARDRVRAYDVTVEAGRIVLER
jgi:nitrite reductase (NADH) small subunit